MRGVSLIHPVLSSLFFSFYLGSFSYTSRAGFIFLWGVSLTHFMIALFFCGKFLLHFPCWLHFLCGGVSHTHPVIALFFCGKFLLHFPCWLHFYAGSLSYTSRAVYSFMQGVSVTHSLLFFFFFFLLFFFKIWGVSLTHPKLVLPFIG